MTYLGLCIMCSPRGVSESKLCPVCGSCRHICRGATGSACGYPVQAAVQAAQQRHPSSHVRPEEIDSEHRSARDVERANTLEWGGEDIPS